jgi:hypothetical protein
MVISSRCSGNGIRSFGTKGSVTPDFLMLSNIYVHTMNRVKEGGERFITQY